MFSEWTFIDHYIDNSSNIFIFGWTNSLNNSLAERSTSHTLQNRSPWERWEQHLLTICATRSTRSLALALSPLSGVNSLLVTSGGLALVIVLPNHVKHAITVTAHRASVRTKLVQSLHWCTTGGPPSQHCARRDDGMPSSPITAGPAF